MTRTLRYWLLRGYIFFAPLTLMACNTTQNLPKEVRVPVPVPCEIAQVDPVELPVASADAGIYELAQVASARVLLLMAENERLRAANSTPCPTEMKP